MKDKEIRKGDLRQQGRSVGAMGGSSSDDLREKGSASRNETSGYGPRAGCASRRHLKLGCMGGPATQSGARIGGGVLDNQARN
jgi:hypothetical protein